MTVTQNSVLVSLEKLAEKISEQPLADRERQRLNLGLSVLASELSPNGEVAGLSEVQDPKGVLAVARAFLQHRTDLDQALLEKAQRVVDTVTKFMDSQLPVNLAVRQEAETLKLALYLSSGVSQEQLGSFLKSATVDTICQLLLANAKQELKVVGLKEILSRSEQSSLTPPEIDMLKEATYPLTTIPVGPIRSVVPTVRAALMSEELSEPRFG